ncbi:MAG: TAXI family TRAP transporter solute-binding subunit [Rickettsiales bacterium]|nr:TAXI family TRAP transporter solute-binding subunit [Rickettsiales bacterium]
MKARRFYIIPSLLFVLVLAQGAWAKTADEPLGIVTGPKTGTYYAFGKDIARMAAKSNFKIEIKSSEGSTENIRRLNSSENAGLGIVQSDVLGFLSRSKNPDSVRMAGNLRMVFPFYHEEVHIFGRKSIKNFADLQGLKVAVGEEGSGNLLTAINLFSMMNVTPSDTIKISPEKGLVAVLKGELDAVIFVAGKPVRLFKNLEDFGLPENKRYAAMLEDTHFIPLDDPKILEEYKPADLTHDDYSFIGSPVPTVSVQAILVSYDFSKNDEKARCEKIGKLADIIRNNFSELKESGHMKWKEVNLNAKAGGWKRDNCAWQEKPEPTPKKKLNTEEFLNLPIGMRGS